MDGRINLKARLALAIFLLCSACFTASADTCLKTLYLDGVKIDDVNVDNGLTWPYDRITIGAEGTRGYLYNKYIGKIDEFAIYQGVLDVNRITEHWGARNSGSAYTAAVQYDNPLLWLRFEDATTDHNDIALNSGSIEIDGQYVATGTEIITQAVGINADSNCIVLPDAEVNGLGTCVDVWDGDGDFGEDTEGDVTIELWVNFVDINSMPGNSYPRFFQHNGNWQDTGGYGLMATHDNYLGVIGGGTTNYMELPYDINDGSWHHIVVTYDSTYYASDTYFEEVMTDDPVLYLRFEQEPLVDSSGNNYWVDANDAVIIEETQGSIGKAAYLNGGWVAAANQQTEPALPTDYNHAYAFAPNDITFEFWLCTPEPNAVDSYAKLFNQCDTQTSPCIYAPGATRANNAGEQKCRMLLGDADGSSPYAYTWPNTWVQDANWHHHVVIWEELPETNEISVKWYRDAQNFKDSTYSTDGTGFRQYLGPEMDHILIGNYGSRDAPGYAPYRQYIDEFAIYSGVLPLSRIQAHYRAGGFVRYLYVDGSATGGGTSWEDAFKYLQDALSAAEPNDQIWVAQGTYRPDEDSSNPSGTGDRDATFQLINGVALYGGFPSGGGSWSSRNPNIYQTILSGDLDGNDVYVSDPCDLLDEPTRAENSYHVVTGSGTEPNAILDGFTITAGNANGSWPNYWGGGMYNDSGNSTVTNCTFSSNSASGSGGGMYNDESSPILTNCTFSKNSAESAGGMSNRYESSPTLTNCTFSGNSTINDGGGMWNLQDCSPMLNNCTFMGNTSDFGGGIYNYVSSPTVTNCTFSGNSAGIRGGGMYNGDSSSSTVTNCMFSGNSATYFGGGIYTRSDANITNCILWGNADPGGTDESAQIHNDGGSTLIVNYCCVQGWTGGLGGTGNIGDDPMFWDTRGHIFSNSPCVNAGDPNFVPDPNAPYDIDGQSRVLEGRVDIGVDELPPAIQNIDTNDVYDTIQEAINDAYNGQTIVVQPGIYTGPNNFNIDFWGKAITLRGSDPNDPNVVAATIIDCNGLGRGFSFHEGEDANSVLDGFTVANGYEAENGGGVLCSNNSNPTISNCIIRNNSAVLTGGGIHCYQSSPTIKNCTIRNNTVLASEGGGIYCDAYSVLTINGGTIKDNSPDGMWIDGTVLILGTVHIISNDIVGDGTVQIDPSGSLDLDDAHVFCSMSGTGTMAVALGAKATIDGDAFIDLGDPCNPNIKGTIDCKGLLTVRDNGRITKAKINITKARFKDRASISNSEINVDSKAPYGQVFAEPNTSFVDVNIYADGDRYMDLDPLIFDGNFVNVKIFVRVTEGVGTRFGGLFECRGDDGLAVVNWSDPNNDPNKPFFIKAVSGTIPNCDFNSWTLEKLELIEGAKLNLTNRFPFQQSYDYNDVVYVKELILGPNSVLNLAFNKLYYESLSMDPSAVVTNLPLLGFSVINIALDDQTEYIVRVAHNNYTDPDNQNYNRVHVERVTGLSPDPNGMMRMCALKDKDPGSPTYQQDVNACAKGTFAKTSEDEDVAIEFEYIFTADPCGDAELVVYLSDDPELGQNPWEVGRVRPPASGRPGSIGSNRFAVFTGLFPAESFYFIRGTYIELRLLGSAGASCLINNWDPKVNCIGICGDFNIDVFNIVDIYDYLVLLAESGLCNPGSVGKGCLDLIGDGHVNNDDVLAWGTDELLHACGGGGSGGSLAAGASVAGKALLTVPASEKQGNSETEPLLTCGKPSGVAPALPGNYLYSVDTDGVCVDANQTNRAGRLVTDSDGGVYQIDGYEGLVNLDTGMVVVEPNTIDNYLGSKVVVGYDNGAGLLLSDAVFKPGDANFVYIVPVQVNPLDGNCPYMAAAKLQLTGDGNYDLLQLYGKNPATDPCQQNTITDCDGALLYEPDVQNLHEIEIDYEGNLYVLSSDWFNENNWLLVYDELIGNASEMRLSLASYTDLVGPTAMVVSSFADMLYLTSSAGGPNDLISEVYRFLIDLGEPNLILDDMVEVNCPAPGVCAYPNMCDPEAGYVSMITSMIESPVDGTLYATGFTAPKFPYNAVMSDWPYNQAGGIFTTPMLAEVTLGASGMIEAVNITGGSLVLPFSLVWTGPLAPPEEKCGGADLDGSGDVGFPDLYILVPYWLETDCGSFGDCGGADLEPLDLPDGDVDMLDIAVFAEHWLETGCND